MTDAALLHTDGAHLVDAAGRRVILRGVGLGGWLNMENFITGYPGTETLMREAVGEVLGAERAELFFDRLLTNLFAEADADLLVELGVNCVRLPFNYRRFTSDERPDVVDPAGFRHLDRAVRLCAARGIYTVLDLHALPGAQNQHWHSDNPTHVAAFWRHRVFQDQAVLLWEALAEHYRDEPYVAGYNLINEPADPTGRVIGPFYDRLVAAVRAVDPRHILFLDGNTYATDFSFFPEPLAGTAYDNVVFACHDYALAGMSYGGRYPGKTQGVWVDRAHLERTFEKRSAYQRRTGTPIWVGEFGPVYTGDPERDAERYRILADQLEIYAEQGAGWSIWTYKDVGLQGLVHVDPASAYLRRFGEVVAKKARLGVDSWASTDAEVPGVLEPLHDLVGKEFPGWSPYPWGARGGTDDLVRHILFAQAQIGEYAEEFRGLDDAALWELADSFTLSRCVRRDRLTAMVARFTDTA